MDKAGVRKGGSTSPSATRVGPDRWDGGWLRDGHPLAGLQLVVHPTSTVRCELPIYLVEPLRYPGRQLGAECPDPVEVGLRLGEEANEWALFDDVLLLYGFGQTRNALLFHPLRSPAPTLETENPLVTHLPEHHADHVAADA